MTATELSKGDRAITDLDDVRRTLSLKLSIVVRVMTRRFEESIEKVASISRSKFGVIAVVSRHPGASQRLVAEALDVSEVTAGRLIDRLVTDGYLQRSTDTADRRVKSVELTPRTKDLLDELAYIAEEQEKLVFDGISEDELQMLNDLIDRIQDNLERGSTA